MMNQLQTRALRGELVSARDEAVVISLIVSAFVSFYALCAVGAAVVLYLCFSGRAKELIVTIPGAKALVGLGALSIVVSAVYGKDMQIVIAIGMAMALLLFLYLRSVMTNALFDAALDWACAASFFSVAVAGLQMFRWYGVIAEFRTDSVFLNPNYFAAMMEMVTLIALFRLLHAKKAKRIAFYIAVIFSSVLGVLFSGCRTALVVIGVSVPVLLVLLRKWKLVGLYGGLVALAAAAWLAIGFELPRWDAIDGDLTLRLSIWRTAAAGFTQTPLFGQGCMAYEHIYPLFGGAQTTHAHNLMLDCLLDFGLVGCSLALVYFGRNVGSLWFVYVDDVNRSRAALSLALVFSVLVHGIVDTTVLWPQTGLLIGLVLACPIRRLSPLPSSSEKG